MLTVEQALEHILSRVAPLGVERVLLLDAMSRILAEPVVSTRTLPPHDNSAMDGYAVVAADIAAASRERPVILPIGLRVGAGHLPSRPLQPGEAARVMTGAAVPEGADAVIKREDTDEGDAGAPAASGGKVGFFVPADPGAHIRRRGDDIAEGAEVLRVGDAIGPAEIGLCAGLGRAVLTVRRRPTVAILSTGDELCDVDQVPAPGQIVNSNVWALAAQVAEAGGLPIVLGHARDDAQAIRARIREGLAADVLLTSGGVSVGDFDLVRGALEAEGVGLEFWKVAMKPGKPVTFGRGPGGRLVFGLPGNPASSMVAFELFVRPALRGLMGDLRPRQRVTVMLEDGFERGGGRVQFLRAVVRIVRKPGQGDRWIAHLLRSQDSHKLSSMARSNALVELPADTGRVVPGEAVTAILTGVPVQAEA